LLSGRGVAWGWGLGAAWGSSFEGAVFAVAAGVAAGVAACTAACVAAFGAGTGGAATRAARALGAGVAPFVEAGVLVAGPDDPLVLKYEAQLGSTLPGSRWNCSYISSTSHSLAPKSEDGWSDGLVCCGTGGFASSGYVRVVVDTLSRLVPHAGKCRSTVPGWCKV
jgi:hypothetical protein